MVFDRLEELFDEDGALFGRDEILLDCRDEGDIPIDLVHALKWLDILLLLLESLVGRVEPHHLRPDPAISSIHIRILHYVL